MDDKCAVTSDYAMKDPIMKVEPDKLLGLSDCVLGVKLKHNSKAQLVDINL